MMHRGRYDFCAMTGRYTNLTAFKRSPAGRVARFDFPDRSAA